MFRRRRTANRRVLNRSDRHSHLTLFEKKQNVFFIHTSTKRISFIFISFAFERFYHHDGVYCRFPLWWSLYKYQLYKKRMRKMRIRNACQQTGERERAKNAGGVVILFFYHIPSNKAESFIMPTPHLLCLVMVFFHRMIHKNVCAY